MDKEAESTLEIGHHLRRGKRLARHVWNHFLEDRCFEEAASLGYTSLLAMVPLLAVVFGIVAAFPVFNEWSERLQSFIFDNFMPATGEQIVPYLNTFLDSISSLTLPGTVMLIVTALLLMVRIEVAFNRIWRVDRNRTLINRVVMYWAVLTLGPILIAAAVAISAQKVFSTLGLEEGMSPGVYRLGIYFITWLVFALMFLLVPNRRVQIKHALIGAFLSTILFEAAKAGFVAYVSNANYTVIYGALATVPIFLFWLYLVWIVTLFGASLAASLTTFSDFSKYDTDWPVRWEFQLAYRLVHHLWSAQREGASLSQKQLLGLELQASELQILKLLHDLRDQKVVTTDEEGNWLLNRDLEEISLGNLYGYGNYYLPLGEIGELPSESEIDRAFVDCLEYVRAHGESSWNQSLRSMYQSSEQERSAS
jgi:membrane protein